MQLELTRRFAELREQGAPDPIEAEIAVDPPSRTPDPDTLEALRSLGYVRDESF